MVNISKFILKDATCVIVGSWNLAILNPDWLSNTLFELPEGTEIPVEVSVGPFTVFKANIKDLFIVPKPNKLVVNPAREDDKLFELADQMVLKLYDLLPYTPVEAIGHNFTYELDDSEKFSIGSGFVSSGYEDIYKTIGASPGADSRLQHSVLLKEGTALNLAFIQSQETRAIHMNYHYEGKVSEKIRFALGRFYEDYRHSKSIETALITRK